MVAYLAFLIIGVGLGLKATALGLGLASILTVVLCALFYLFQDMGALDLFKQTALNVVSLQVGYFISVVLQAWLGKGALRNGGAPQQAAVPPAAGEPRPAGRADDQRTDLQDFNHRSTASAHGNLDAG